MSSTEHGLQILRDTGCKVGQHVFVWSGVWHSTSKEPDPSQPCLCGLTTWARVKP